jgi:hypothetical protein
VVTNGRMCVAQRSHRGSIEKFAASRKKPKSPKTLSPQSGSWLNSALRIISFRRLLVDRVSNLKR